MGFTPDDDEHVNDIFGKLNTSVTTPVVLSQNLGFFIPTLDLFEKLCFLLTCRPTCTLLKFIIVQWFQQQS